LQADKYATSGIHSYASAEQLAWGSRWPRILQEIQKYDADVLCLQEVRHAAHVVMPGLLVAIVSEQTQR
jgi:mRNA deadenylase 3'-5' endonuclease subunit Ccr4